MTSPRSKARVVVAMSGGVDSSVCAYLLKKAGYDVVGVTIKTWSDDECKDEKSKGCCSIRDIADARSVARQLAIPFYVMDLSADFKGRVIDYFVEEYLSGRTPNPCVECNRHIKFGLLLAKAEELEASFVATGHYARKVFDEKEGRFTVREGVDKDKDQSYVLFGLSQKQLAKVLLPVGDYKKGEIRAAARAMGLRVYDKPDSQEICFVKKDYGSFVKGYAPERLPGAGNFIGPAGEVLGRHEGSHLYTVGQRKRIRFTHAKPLYVTAIDAEKNEVHVGPEEDLVRRELSVGRFHWLLKPRLGRAWLKIRYKHTKTQAEICAVEKDRVMARFFEGQRAVAPGQAAVFYDGDRVLGGGWIENVQDFRTRRPAKPSESASQKKLAV